MLILYGDVQNIRNIVPRSTIMYNFVQSVLEGENVLLDTRIPLKITMTRKEGMAPVPRREKKDDCVTGEGNANAI